ncbi:MAG: restriction endonuclease subunit S [Peptococcaceae bacterium]|nr:restriction endonuclease subunit S [Peptococcaceae bacterium]
MQKDSEYFVTKGPYKSYPGDWKVIELGNLLNKVRRPVKVIPNHEYQEIGIRSHGKGLFHKEPVKGSDLGNKSVFWVEVDCLIINIVFAWEQAVGITTDQEKGMIASHRFPMWRSKGNIDINYLLMFFLTPLGRHLLELASPGGAGRNKTLGQDDFNKTPVCIPSNIKEQQKIVKILTTWNMAIELEERLISEKRQQKKWLMQNLLTGKKRLPGFADEWHRLEVGKVILQSSAKMNPIIEKQAFKCIELEHIESGTGRLLGSTISTIQKSNKNFFVKGDILFGKLRPYLKKFYYAKQDGVCSSEIWVLRPKTKKILSKYLFYIIQSSKFIEKCCVSSGSKMPRADWDYVSDLVIDLPPLPEQTAIAEILSTADREIDLHEKQLEELKKQKKALMQLLLTGIVRVNAQEVS